MLDTLWTPTGRRVATTGARWDAALTVPVGEYRVAREPRIVNGVTVSTVRWPFENEAGHEVRVNGAIVVVRPDGVSTSRKRSCAISEACAAPLVDEGDRLALLVGRLLLVGAHRVEVDGEPLVPEPGRVVDWVVELGTDGSVVARHVGG